MYNYNYVHILVLNISVEAASAGVPRRVGGDNARDGLGGGLHWRQVRHHGRGLSLTDTKCLLISFGKSNPPQNRQPNILVRNSRQ